MSKLLELAEQHERTAIALASDAVSSETYGGAARENWTARAANHFAVAAALKARATQEQPE
jgi:hypothetical protein